MASVICQAQDAGEDDDAARRAAAAAAASAAASAAAAAAGAYTRPLFGSKSALSVGWGVNLVVVQGVLRRP